MKKRRFASPPPLGESDSSLRETVRTLQEGFSYITGQRRGEIKPLAAGASNAEIIAKINEMIARLQGSE